MSDKDLNRDKKDTEIPARAAFFGEIGEKDQKRDSTEYTKNIMEGTGQEVPANYMSDNNWDKN